MFGSHEGGCCWFSCSLGVVGAVFIGYWLVKFAIWFYSTFLYKSSKVKKYVGKDNWAVITGCCAGIGEGFSLELAKRGTNLVLIDFNAKRLPEFAKEIEEKYKIKTISVVMDLSKKKGSEEYEKQYAELIEKTKGVKTTVLINNVGINTRKPKYFLEHSERELDMFGQINLNAALDMTQIFLPRFIEQKCGLIISLASIQGFIPSPMYSIYSASKAYIRCWNKVIRGEYMRKKGIEIFAVAPMFVKSDMTGFRKTSISVITGQHLARVSLDRVGCPFNDDTFSPYWHHSMMMFIMQSLPYGFIKNQIFKRNISLRKYFDRKERERAEKIK